MEVNLDMIEGTFSSRGICYTYSRGEFQKVTKPSKYPIARADPFRGLNTNLNPVKLSFKDVKQIIKK